MKAIKNFVANVVAVLVLMLVVLGSTVGIAKYWQICDNNAAKANHHNHRPAINYMPE